MIKLTALLVLLASIAAAQQTLSALVGRNRVLLIFAPTALDGRFGQQLDALDHHVAELRERDLVVIPLIEQPGPANRSTVLRTLQPPLVRADEQITFRRRFNIAPSDFVVILVGKDGTEKIRSHAPLSAARLNRTIDAMPGRQDEMRKQP